jgi:hypothetical protein
MELRNGTVIGRSQLPPEARPAFEEGVGLIFSQWTALCLAVENEWGGPMSSDKADQLIDDIIQWFYRKRGRLRLAPLAAGHLPCGLSPRTLATASQAPPCPAVQHGGGHPVCRAASSTHST